MIAWLYRPAEGEPEPVAAVVEPAAELAGTEPAPAALPEPAAPDSGVVEVGVERVAADHGLPLEPVPAPPPAEPTVPGAEPSWDPYAFDGAMPDGVAGARDASLPVPAAYVRTEPPPCAAAATPAGESPSAIFGTVDVALITREAVAQAAVDALPLTGAVDVAGLEALAAPEPHAPNAAAEVAEILTAVPVGEWMPDGDPLGPDPFAPENLLAPGRADPIVPSPPPLPPAVAKITPPPLPAWVQPPPLPLPPPPPESA